MLVKSCAVSVYFSEGGWNGSFEFGDQLYCIVRQIVIFDMTESTPNSAHSM